MMKRYLDLEEFLNEADNRGLVVDGFICRSKDQVGSFILPFGNRNEDTLEAILSPRQSWTDKYFVTKEEIV